MVEVEGAHRLSPAEREVLRLRVVAALESEKVEGYRQAAEVFGMTERSMASGGVRRDDRDGLATLEGRLGPAELISAEDRGTPFTAMADYTPEELLIDGPLWTRQAVVEPIRLVVRIGMTEHGIGL